MPHIQMNNVRKLDTLIYVLSNGGGDLTANVNTEVKLCNGKGTVGACLQPAGEAWAGGLSIGRACAYRLPKR